MRRLQTFALGERIDSIRPKLNAIVESINGTGAPVSIESRPAWNPQRVLVLEIKVLQADTLLCTLPGQQLNPSAQEWTVVPPWTLTELSRGGVNYVYSDINNRVADGTETQQLTPFYTATDFIMAAEYEQGTVWRDLNIDGRQWAKVP